MMVLKKTVHYIKDNRLHINWTPWSPCNASEDAREFFRFGEDHGWTLLKKSEKDQLVQLVNRAGEVCYEYVDSHPLQGKVRALLYGLTENCLFVPEHLLKK